MDFHAKSNGWTMQNLVSKYIYALQLTNNNYIEGCHANGTLLDHSSMASSVYQHWWYLALFREKQCLLLFLITVERPLTTIVRLNIFQQLCIVILVCLVVTRLWHYLA